jgi:hypothetical protein
MRSFWCAVAVCALATDVWGATGVDFESAADVTCSCVAFAPDGFLFSTVSAGTDDVVGCPCFARRGPPNNAFLGCSGGTDCGTGTGLADGTVGGQGVGCVFLTDDLDPIGIDGGDLLVEFSAPVATVSGDLIDVDLSSTFAEAFTITGRDCSGAPVLGATATVTAPSGPTTLACEPALAPGPGSGTAVPFLVASASTNICSILVGYTGTLTRSQADWAIDNIAVDVNLPPHSSQLPAVHEKGLWILIVLVLAGGHVLGRTPTSPSRLR